MKTFLSFFLVLFSWQMISAQYPDFIWAERGGGSGVGNGISTDINGNVYIAGYFNGYMSFGTTTLTSSNNDAFITKYDENGNVLWAKKIGGNNDDFGLDITTDSKGNAYVLGCFRNDTIIFGDSILINPSVQYYLFICKYDSIGNEKWAMSIKNDFIYNFPNKNSIVIDEDDNIILSSYFASNTLTFDTITITNQGSFFSLNNIFIVKLDTSGHAYWAKSLGSDYDNDFEEGIYNDNYGNIYITGGFYSDTIKFDSISLVNSNYGGEDFFIAKYNSNGNVIWAKSVGGNGGHDVDVGKRITSDSFGNIYVAGEFNTDSIIFGNTTLYNSANPTQIDLFIVKYDSIGNVLWAKNTVNTYHQYVNGICNDLSGNIFITGSFTGSTFSVGNFILTNPNGNNGNVFIAKYNYDGDVLWAYGAGGTENDQGNGITNDSDGNIYITGGFGTSGITFGNFTLSNGGGYGTYTARLSKTVFNKEILNKSEINIYPNPAHNQLIIIESEAKQSQISIYNLQGQQVKSIKTKGQSKRYTVNIKNLPAGLYFVKIKTNNGEIIRKFVKQ